MEVLEDIVLLLFLSSWWWWLDVRFITMTIDNNDEAIGPLFLCSNEIVVPFSIVMNCNKVNSIIGRSNNLIRDQLSIKWWKENKKKLTFLECDDWRDLHSVAVTAEETINTIFTCHHLMFVLNFIDVKIISFDVGYSQLDQTVSTFLIFFPPTSMREWTQHLMIMNSGRRAYNRRWAELCVTVKFDNIITRYFIPLYTLHEIISNNTRNNMTSRLIDSIDLILYK